MRHVPRIGMGCWAIGGAFWSGDIPLGYFGGDLKSALKTVQAAWDAGTRIFDTSAVYGAGQSERVLGEALQGRNDAIIISKFGHSINPDTRQMTGPQFNPAYVRRSVEDSLTRLRRDRIDVMLLHINGLLPDDAQPAFDTLEDLVTEGKLTSYGWSTDFPDGIAAFGARPHFSTVQHSMNVFFDAPSMNAEASTHGLTQLIRSPLAMGVLTGKFRDGRRVPEDDIRSAGRGWQGYFEASRPLPELMETMDALHDLLCVGGRSIGQGALCWLLTKGEAIIPIPGAKTEQQAIENAGALEFGPLPDAIMAEIEQILQRPPEDEPRAR